MKDTKDKTTQSPTGHSFLDPSYDFKQFSNELFSGQFRWLASILGFGSAGLLLYWLLSGSEPSFDFPFSVRGSLALVVVLGMFLFWTVPAIKNWIFWFRHK